MYGALVLLVNVYNCIGESIKSIVVELVNELDFGRA